MKAKVFCFALMGCLIPLTGLTCPEDCLEGQPNLTVLRIDFELVEQTSESTGTVRITGVAENTGSGVFDSSAGQQSLQLYSGQSLNSLTLLETQEFVDVMPGEQIMVTHTMSWSTTDEFPPLFQAVLSYDPDIYIDGNDDNDDCATSDNAVQRDGSEINDLF